MGFLVDEDMPRSTSAVIRRYNYEATDVRDIGLRGAPDARIAREAQERGLCLLTGDLGFSDIRRYPPAAYAGIVVVRVPASATASTILNLVEAFLSQAELVSDLSAKLAIVEPGRVRLRQG